MMSPVRIFSFAFLLAATSAFSFAPAFAQNAPSGNIVQFNDPNSPNATILPVSSTAPQSAPANNAGDPQAPDPQSRVGRISLIDGTVSFHTPDQDSWSLATLNYPVVSGYSFWAEPGSHAEVEAGAAQLRLDGGTEADIVQLDDRGLRANVQQGTADIHVTEIDPGETYQITTPNETVTLLQPGTYRIHPGGGQGPDEIAVLKGSAQVGDSESTLNVTSGETAVINPGVSPDIAIQQTVPTTFDNWSLERDNFEEPRAVSQYVSPQMTGDQDLDRYGAWQSDPTYGNVWYPTTVVAGWQPYHYGHWVWVSPWGWTWIDDAPWGFAPFHYGRWVYAGNRWGWVPGERIARPVYAPALVAFVGGGGWGLSVGIGARPVGWFPLGPGEVYRPGYHASDRYMHSVNSPYFRNATALNHAMRAPQSQHFANRSFTTVVSSHDFASARPVDKAVIHVSASRLNSAPVTMSAAPSMHERPQTVGSRAPAPPAAPHAPIHPNVAGANAAGSHGIAPRLANSMSSAHPSAPGPAIIHRDFNASPSMHAPQFNPAAIHETGQETAHAGTPAVQTNANFQHEQQRAAEIQAHAAAGQNANAHVAAPNAQSHAMQPAAQVQHAAPREIQVQHPQQSAPLVPSREGKGWVRQQPAPAAQHAEPAHSEPAHAAPAPHAEAPHENGGGHEDEHH